MNILKKLNKKQKIILIVELGIIILSVIVWVAFGSEIFTKTKVLVKHTDPILGNSYSEWSPKFIWGLDLSLLVSGITLVISFILVVLFRNKKITR